MDTSYVSRDLAATMSRALVHPGLFAFRTPLYRLFGCSPVDAVSEWHVVILEVDAFYTTCDMRREASRGMSELE